MNEILAILVSFGSGGVLVATLSTLLGRLWADRLMTEETAKHDRKLSELRKDLDVYKSTHHAAHQDKLSIYRMAVDLVAELLVDLNKRRRSKKKLTPLEREAALDRFYRDRLKLYGYLAMLAPQTMMDAHDKTFDYLLKVVKKPREYDWSTVRGLVIDTLNEIRKDLAIDSSALNYEKLPS